MTMHDISSLINVQKCIGTQQCMTQMRQRCQHWIGRTCFGPARRSSHCIRLLVQKLESIPYLSVRRWASKRAAPRQLKLRHRVGTCGTLYPGSKSPRHPNYERVVHHQQRLRGHCRRRPAFAVRSHGRQVEQFQHPQRHRPPHLDVHGTANDLFTQVSGSPHHLASRIESVHGKNNTLSRHIGTNRHWIAVHLARQSAGERKQ